MPKPPLQEPYRSLEHQIIDTLRAGLQEWRLDLQYPESYSDMQGAVRALMRRFEVTMRPVDLKELPIYEECCAKCGKPLGSIAIGYGRASFHDECAPNSVLKNMNRPVRDVE